jgi:hypothetical protein
MHAVLNFISTRAVQKVVFRYSTVEITTKWVKKGVHIRRHCSQVEVCEAYRLHKLRTIEGGWVQGLLVWVQTYLQEGVCVKPGNFSECNLRRNK